MRDVCIDARLYSASGIGTFLQTAIPALAESGKFRLFILGRKEEREQLSAFCDRFIEMSSWIYSLKEQFEYALKIPSCALFWAPHYNVPLLPIRAKKRVTTICDVLHLAQFSKLTLKQKLYAKTMYASACRLSDCVTTLSEFSKEEILKYVSVKPKQLSVITTPFSFEPSAEEEPKEPFLLYVGNIKPHKNLVRLVQAYDQLKPKELLYIVGKKEGLHTPDSVLFEEVEKSDFLKKNVRYLGFVTESQLKKLYKQTKLFIFPSTYEGYGYPPLEAMASGCPVVASNRASIPEVCGTAVEYVNPFSVSSIAAGIQKLLADETTRQSYIQKGFAHVKRMKMMQNQIVELLDACCSDS